MSRDVDKPVLWPFPRFYSEACRWRRNGGKVDSAEQGGHCFCFGGWAPKGKADSSYMMFLGELPRPEEFQITIGVLANNKSSVEILWARACKYTAKVAGQSEKRVAIINELEISQWQIPQYRHAHSCSFSYVTYDTLGTIFISRLWISANIALVIQPSIDLVNICLPVILAKNWVSLFILRPKNQGPRNFEIDYSATRMLRLCACALQTHSTTVLVQVLCGSHRIGFIIFSTCICQLAHRPSRWTR